MTNSFWARNWNTFFTGTYRPPQVFGSYQRGRRLPPSCGGRRIGYGNASHRVPGDFIAWDLSLMADGHRSGDAWVYLVIAHEWGHAVQARAPALAGAAGPGGAGRLLPAGAALFGAAAQKLLTFEEGDVAELQAALRRMGDRTPWTDVSDYGSAAERITFFTRGAEEASAPACPPRRGTAHRHDDLRWTFVGHDATDTIGVGRTPQSASATDRSGHRLRKTAEFGARHYRRVARRGVQPPVHEEGSPRSSVTRWTRDGGLSRRWAERWTRGSGGLATVDSRRWTPRRWTRDGGLATVDSRRWTRDGGLATVDSRRWTRDGGLRDGGLATVDPRRWTPAAQPGRASTAQRAQACGPNRSRPARTHREGQVASDTGKLSGARAARAGVFC